MLLLLPCYPGVAIQQDDIGGSNKFWVLWVVVLFCSVVVFVWLCVVLLLLLFCVFGLVCLWWVCLSVCFNYCQYSPACLLGTAVNQLPLKEGKKSHKDRSATTETYGWVSAATLQISWATSKSSQWSQTGTWWRVGEEKAALKSSVVQGLLCRTAATWYQLKGFVWRTILWSNSINFHVEILPPFCFYLKNNIFSKENHCKLYWGMLTTLPSYFLCCLSHVFKNPCTISS